MLDTLRTLATGRQFAALLILLALFAVVFVAVRLGFRHKREKEDTAAQDNRNRTLFQAGIADRAGDRTAELLDQIRQYNGPQNEAPAAAILTGRTTHSDASRSGPG